MPQVDVTVEEYTDGVLVSSTVKTVEVTQESLNDRDIRQKAQNALANNATFLAIATPTAAQNAAQVKALTRQNNGLIRVMLGVLDDVSDT